MIKKIKYLVLIITLITINILPVKADVLDFTRPGKVEITLKESEEQTPISKVEITLYQIANANEDNHNLIFTYHENITDCNVDLYNLENETIASEINKCITNVNLPSQTKLTQEDGTVNFDELRLGLYLIKQTNEVEGYSKIEPFLIMLPLQENNTWKYDVKAIPKTDIIRVMNLSVEKVWNDSSNLENHPQSVTIELYKGEELIDTIKLSEDNNWIYTWNKIPLSDEYLVKEINVPDEYTDTYRQVGNKFIVTNTKTLVQTGMNLLLVELLAVTGIICIIIGIICEKRKKYE